MSDTITTSELAIVIGSVREGRFGPVAASWVAGQATAHDDDIVCGRRTAVVSGKGHCVVRACPTLR